MTITKEQVDGLMIEVASEGCATFLVSLTEDGNIKRNGSGAMSAKKETLCVGQLNEPLFTKVRAVISDDLLALVGQQFAMPDPKGMLCKMTLSFKVGEYFQQIVVNYGLKSGLPNDVLVIVKTMHEVTEPWWQKMSQGLKKMEKKKGFWLFGRSK